MRPRDKGPSAVCLAALGSHRQVVLPVSSWWCQRSSCPGPVGRTSCRPSRWSPIVVVVHQVPLAPRGALRFGIVLPRFSSA